MFNPFGLGVYKDKKQKPKPDIQGIVDRLRQKKATHSKFNNFLTGRNERLRVAESVLNDK